VKRAKGRILRWDELTEHMNKLERLLPEGSSVLREAVQKLVPEYIPTLSESINYRLGEESTSDLVELGAATPATSPAGD
jgi:hypothetical protein